MASLVDYEDSDSETDQDLQLYHDEAVIISSSSSSSSAAAQSGSSGSMKRVQLQASAVRPYVPKRQRLTETAAGRTEEPDPSGSAAGSPALSEVSERVRPFLGRRHGRVELPRRMQSHIQAHQGPVNTLQWSPVDHLSHLLLSASMDRTFKVRLT